MLWRVLTCGPHNRTKFRSLLGLASAIRRAILAIFAYRQRAMKKWITATLLIAAAAVAQQTHNQYEPPNATGAGQRLLAQFTGDWDLVKRFFPMNGKPIVTKGTCKQYMIQDGKFLQSDFTFFDPDGTTSTGTGISGFDPKANRFTTVWYDSRQTTMSIRRAMARSTARTSSCGPRPSIPTVLGARRSRARTLRKTATFSSIAIS
jgi:hypothetical protein